MCGIRLHDLAEAPLEERIAQAAALGYRCIHLASKVVYAAYGIDSAGLTPQLAAQLKAACERAGVTVAVFGCYKNLALPDGPAFDAVLNEYEHCAQFAAWLGADVVGTETGRPNEGNIIAGDRFAAGALDRVIAHVEQAAERCAHAGMPLALEPGYNEVVCTPERCRAVLDAVAAENLGIIYDPVSLVHPALVRGTAGDAAVRQQVSDMLAWCGDRVMVLHAKDFELAPATPDGTWADETGERIVCHGAGEIGAFDMAPLAAWARRVHPGIPCVVENSTPATAAACRAYLKRL